jgi:hypothetical protein
MNRRKTMNKFEYQESGYTEPTEEDEKRIFTEEFLVKDVFDKKVLMTTGREFNELYKTLPEGVHYFAIRGCDDDPSIPATVEDKVFVNRCGSMLSKEDLIAPERKTCNPNDIYRILNDEERKRFYDMLWDCDNQANIPEEEEQEWMTISDFIHKDDEEFEVCIEEVIHHTVKVKAKDAEEATILAAKKYVHDDNFCDTTTETGSIDDVLISAKENSGPLAGEYGEFKDLYDYTRDKIDGKPVI